MIKEKRYKVSVKTPNRFLNIKGRIVRTPTDFFLYENELKAIKTKFHSDGITDFSIDEIIYDKTKKIETKQINEEIKVQEEKIDTIVENKKEESTLSKILNS